MSSLVQPSPFLRRVLLADAAFSVAGAALMAFGAALLAGPTGIPTSLLLSAGLALFPYAAYVAWLATRRAVPRAAIWVPIVLNVVWAADCALVLSAGDTRRRCSASCSSAHRSSRCSRLPSWSSSGCAARVRWCRTEARDNPHPSPLLQTGEGARSLVLPLSRLRERARDEGNACAIVAA